MEHAHLLPISELAPLIASRRVRVASVVEACLARIDADNTRLNAFVTVMRDEALAAARQADEDIARGHYRGPLHGIPISLKDLVDVAGVPTTAASRVRARHMARADAPVVARLREAGAIFIGKTNLHEFAFGTTSEDSAYGPVRNPHDPSRSAGGSSGGSAVSIVTGMAVASIGTDTGGSIRIPAAACGTVGLKPTLGEVSCDGIVPLSSSLDHAGPLARSVEDARLLYQIVRDEGPSSAPAVPPRDSRTLRLGTPYPYLLDVLDDEVHAVFEASLEHLRRAGVAIVRVAVPHAADTPTIYLHLQLPEASAYHATVVEERPEDYTPAVRLRLELGRYVLAEDYARAQRGRDVLTREVDAALSAVDALVLPTLPIEPAAIGDGSRMIGGRRFPVRALMLRLTQIFNLTGHPAVSLPCGWTSHGLPCGLQLAGRRQRTPDLLAVAACCERYVPTRPGPGIPGGGSGWTSGGGTGGMSGGGTTGMSGGG